MSEWKKVKLGDVISISSGFSYKSDYLGEGNNLLLGMGCVSFKDSFVDSGARPYSQDCDEKYLVKPGDIVLATRQQSNNLPILAMPAIIPQKYEGRNLIVGANLYKVENHSIIDNRFLYYLLKGHDYVGYINGVKTGANVQMVSKRNVEAYSFLCPPLETCNRIATILSRYDSLIENYQKQIKLLEEAALRLYKEWFIDLHFPGHENTNIIDGVPEGWEKKKLGEIANISAGGDKPDVVTEEQTSECQVPIYSNGTTKEGLYGYTNKSSNTAGSITVSARGSIGFACLRMQDYFSIVRLISIKPNKIEDLMYLYQFTKLHTFMSNGAAQQQLTVPMVKAIEVVYPAETLIKAFECAVLSCYKQKQSLQSQLRLLTEARDRLLPKLISGEITV